MTTIEVLQSPASTIPHHSLSRDLQTNGSLPRLLHSLHETKSSVLSLAASDAYIFSGSQNMDISVWDKQHFNLTYTLKGHTGSVLALEYAKEKAWLFSSSGDSTIRVWSTVCLAPIYVINPYLDDGAGDIFSLAWSPVLSTIFIGCQNTSLQWYRFTECSTGDPEGTDSPTPISGLNSGPSSPNETTIRKAHKFFDSYPLYARKPADIFANNGTASNRSPGGSAKSDCGSAPVPQRYIHIPATNVIDSAHYGYIYCMTLIKSINETHLATGSGDETVKLWNCTALGPVLIHEFQCNHGAVLSLSAKDETLYAGCQDGYVKVIDLETKTIVRTIIAEEGVDIISISLLKPDLYTGSANGYVRRWSKSFDCTASWKAHDGIVLSSVITRQHESVNSALCLITGGNDEQIQIWQVAPPQDQSGPEDGGLYSSGDSWLGADTLSYALANFVRIPSVSCNPKHREDCRQAAIWLKKCLGQLGASTALLPTSEGINPLVLGTFTGPIRDRPKPRILFYGHYDVISAPPKGWTSDPFTMTGRNGYLYGRGVTDNKGPIMAVACAASDLLHQRKLELDLVFLIEGEEECGSTGFGETVRKHKDAIGRIDAILVSNSTWIAEDRPCITYGLRGVVHCSLEISSNLPDTHSGIEGGAIAEPMMDMVKLLATLTDSHHHVKIPGFYKHVRAQTKEETDLYNLLSDITKRPASSLSARWREPSLTIHTIEISGPKNATVIPGTVKSQVSIRIVPDQDLNTIATSLKAYLQDSFSNLGSSNRLTVAVERTADWWLGRLDDAWFCALEEAVHEEWGVEPLRIREGGSIPSVPFLEKEFRCRALHLPMGQSSDQAHLPDERISLANLRRGKKVIERFLNKVGESDGLGLVQSS